MIKAKKNKKSDSVKVDMTGNCSQIADEYTAVTQCIAKVFVNSCIPGKLEELKKNCTRK